MSSQLPRDLTALSQKLLQRSYQPDDLAGALTHITQTAQEFFQPDICISFLLNPITKQFFSPTIIVSDVQPPKEVTPEQLQLDKLTNILIHSGPVFVEDLFAETGYQNIYTCTEDIQAFAAVSLCDKNGQPLAVLCLYFRQPQQFTPKYQECVQFLTDQAEYILQNTWFLHRYREVTLIGQSINQELDTIEQLFGQLYEKIYNIIDVSQIFMLLAYKLHTDKVDQYINERGREIVYTNKHLGNASRYVIENQIPLTIQNWYEESDNLPINREIVEDKEENFQSVIFVPLILRGTPLGILSVQHQNPNTYDINDLHLLQILGNHVASALNNIRLFDNMRRLSRAGHTLIQELHSDQVLLNIADQIREIVGADIVVLYPYNEKQSDFDLTRIISGDLLQPHHPRQAYSRPSDIVSVILEQYETIFEDRFRPLYVARMSFEFNESQAYFSQREQIQSTAAVPLRVADEPVGVLFVNFRQTQPFDTSQKQLINGLSNYAAITIKTSREFSALNKQYIRKLELIQEINRKIKQSLSLKEILNSTLQLISENINSNVSSIYLYNPRDEVLVQEVIFGNYKEADIRQKIYIHEEQDIVRYVFQSRKPIRIDNVKKAPWNLIYIPTTDDDILSELDVPITDGEDVIGVINCESVIDAAFTPEDQEFLMTVAGQVELAIKNAQSYEREKRLAAEHRALHEVGSEIVRQLDIERVFDLILEKAIQLTGATSGMLMLYDDRLGGLRMAAVRGSETQDRHLGLGEGIAGWAAEHRTLVNASDINQPPWKNHYSSFMHETRSELAVPMVENDWLHGVINVESPEADHFGADAERLLTGLANLAIIALQNAESYQEAIRAQRRFKLLYEAGEKLSEIADRSQIDQAYDIVLEILSLHTQSWAAIRRYDAESQDLELVRQTHHPYSLFARIKRLEGLDGQVARERRTITIPDTNNSPPDVRSKLSSESIHSLVIAPIIFKYEYYGNLSLSHETSNHFLDPDIELIEGLASQLAMTLHRLASVENATELERRAKEAEVMSSIGQSASELAHRLGNDLGLIRSYVNNVQRVLREYGVAHPTLDENLTKIVQDTRSALGLANNVRDQLQTLQNEGQQTKEWVDLPVSTLLEETARSHSQLPSNIEIRLEIHDDSQVRIVQRQVVAILRNLFFNAVQAMPEGGILTLRSRSEGRYVALQVDDTGIGIAPENLSKIFTLGFSTKKDNYGFGLWSARRYALLNQGDLSVISALGQGTIFTLLLPKSEVQDYGTAI